MSTANQRLSNEVKSKVIDAIMKDVPNAPMQFPQFLEHLQKVFRQRSIPHLPQPVQQLLADEKLRGYIAESTYYLYSYKMDAQHGFSGSHVKRLSKCTGFDSGIITLPYVVGGGRAFKVDPQTALEIVEYYEAVTARRQLHTKLVSAMAGIRTRKSFLAAFPEFEKYLPKDEATTYPVALANVVADLSKMGWPAAANSAGAPAKKAAA